MGFIRGFSIAMGANIIVFALSFINNKLIYLYLPEADNGLYFLVYRYSLFFALFLGDWMRLSNLNIAGKDKSLIPLLSANGFWYISTLLSGFGLLYLLFSSFSLQLPTALPPFYVLAIITAGCAFIARNHWQSLHLVNHRMIPYSITFIIWAMVFLGLDVLFLSVLGLGLKSVMTAFLAATALAAVFAFSTSWRMNGHRFRGSFSVLAMSKKIGTRAWIAILGMFLMISVQAFTVESFADNGENGLVLLAMFSVSFRLFSLLQRVADAAGTVLYSYVVQSDNVSAAELSASVTRNILLFSAVCSFLLVLGGKQVIYIIASSKYIEAYSSLLFILPGIVAVNAGSVLNNYFWGRSYPTPVIAAPYIATVFGGILNFLLIPRYGVSGATLSFSLMSSVWFVFILIYFSKVTGVAVRKVLIPNPADFSVVLSRIRQRFAR